MEDKITALLPNFFFSNRIMKKFQAVVYIVLQNAILRHIVESCRLLQLLIIPINQQQKIPPLYQQQWQHDSGTISFVPKFEQRPWKPKIGLLRASLSARAAIFKGNYWVTGSFVADVSFSKSTVAAAKVIGSMVFSFQAHGAPFASTRRLQLSRLKTHAWKVYDFCQW